MAPGDVLKSPRHSAGTAVDGSQSRVMTGARMEHCRSHFVRLSTSLLLLRPPRRCRGRDFVASPRFVLERGDVNVNTTVRTLRRQGGATSTPGTRHSRHSRASASLNKSTRACSRCRSMRIVEFRENGLLFGRKVAKLTKRSRARRLDVKNDSLP